MVFEYFFFSFRVDRWGSWFWLFYFYLAPPLGFSIFRGSLVSHYFISLSLSQAVSSHFYFYSIFFLLRLGICSAV